MRKLVDKSIVKDFKLRIVVENTVYQSKLLSEHGLSVLLNGHLENGYEFNILFDTGQTGKPLIHNLKELKILHKNIDAIILSHGHYDHTGGIELFLKNYNKNIKIYCHPDVFQKKYSEKRGKLRDIGMPFDRTLLENSGANFITSKSPVKIFDGIYTSGEISRVTSFEKVPDRFKKLENGNLVKDDIVDDLALIIRTEDGIIILTGCAHSGVVNTLYHTSKLFKNEKILGVIGGFHLMGASNVRIEETIKHLKKFNLNIIGPCHCTGMFAISRIIPNFLEQYRECSTGMELLFDII